VSQSLSDSVREKATQVAGEDLIRRLEDAGLVIVERNALSRLYNEAHLLRSRVHQLADDINQIMPQHHYSFTIKELD